MIIPTSPGKVDNEDRNYEIEDEDNEIENIENEIEQISLSQNSVFSVSTANSTRSYKSSNFNFRLDNE